MKIQLKDWKVKELSWITKDPDCKEKTEANTFNLSFGHGIPDDVEREFVIGFKINLSEENFTLYIEMVFMFETDEEINEEFINSSFIKINAPAIAFPYIRSFISNLTVQSGYSPIILPSVNFVALDEAQSKIV